MGVFVNCRDIEL